MKSETPIAKPSRPENLFYKLSIGTLITAALLVILGLVSFVQNQEQQAALDEQSNKTGQLVQQVKDLTEQNKKLSQTAVNYAYCNSVIIARYTQDKDPITVEDLNRCILSSFPEGEGAPTIDEVRATMNGQVTSLPNQSSGNSGGSSNPQPTNPTPPSQPQNPQTPQNPQNPNPNPNPNQNRPTNNLLTLHPTGILPGAEVNTPCLQVSLILGSLGTCRVF